MEKFSLIEELLLLTLEDRGGEFDRVPEAFLVCGIAGGALIDLSLRNKVDFGPQRRLGDRQHPDR